MEWTWNIILKKKTNKLDICCDFTIIIMMINILWLLFYFRKGEQTWNSQINQVIDGICQSTMFYAYLSHWNIRIRLLHLICEKLQNLIWFIHYLSGFWIVGTVICGWIRTYVVYSKWQKKTNTIITTIVSH